MLFDRFHSDGSALGLANHRDEAGIRQHHLGELVHARGGRRAGGADDLVPDRVDRSDVINHAVGKFRWQLLAFFEHVLDAFVRSIATRQQLAREQQGLAGLPRRNFSRRELVEIHARCGGRCSPRDLGPVIERGRLERHGSRSIQDKVRMPRGGAVGDHRHGLVRRVRRVIQNLHVEHRGQAAEALRADAECIDLVVELDAHFLEFGFRSARLQVRHVDGVHERLLRHQHRFFGRAAHADPEHPRRAPSRAHGRHGLEHPIDDRVGGVEHRELGLRLRTAAFGRHIHVHLAPRHQLDVDHRRSVVAGALAREHGIGEDRSAQLVVGIVVGAPHAFVDHVREAQLRLPAHIHADLEEHVDDAGVLADRAVALGAHARIGEDLRDRIFRRERLLALISAAEGLDIILRVVVADVLQGIGDALNEIFLPDGRSHGVSQWAGAGCGWLVMRSVQAMASADTTNVRWMRVCQSNTFSS